MNSQIRQILEQMNALAVELRIKVYPRQHKRLCRAHMNAVQSSSIAACAFSRATGGGDQ
ncbi:MAG TPA: hypothetical protein VFR06_05775 [Gallionellaceae bacterium]|nr:hypothetical protein [Gallionellaceae bacterium]